MSYRSSAGLALGEVGSSAHDAHGGYINPMMKASYLLPHFSQSSPSRLGQQPVHLINHGKWNSKVQAPLSSLNSGGSQSPGSVGIPWGND